MTQGMRPSNGQVSGISRMYGSYLKIIFFFGSIWSRKPVQRKLEGLNTVDGALEFVSVRVIEVELLDAAIDLFQRCFNERIQNAHAP